MSTTVPPANNSYILKGFGAHAQFVNNQHGVTNPIGELSPIAETYSREVGLYYTPNVPDVTLLAFCSEQNGVFSLPDNDLKDRVIATIAWVYNNTLNTAGELYADQIAMQLMTAFPADISDLQSGVMATDGTHWVPAWLSWYDTKTNAFVRIWFSDENFRHTYDEYEVLVSPPIDNIDDFFKAGSDVQNLLTSRDLTTTMLKIAEVRAGHPETYLRAEEFDYHDPLNTSRVVPSNWIILVYGEAGNNIDSIKDALVNYILSNSKHGRDEWVKILPDIFRRTEFTLVPNWTNYAIPERVTQAGIYSPITLLNDAQKLVDTFAPSYDAYHRTSHTTTFSFPYKALSIFACSSEENRDAKYLLTDYFPDYINVSTTSQDFNRQSETTRAFSEMIAQMLITAENMDRYSDIPEGMTRLYRDNILYIVSNYQNVHYLVAAKWNVVNDPVTTTSKTTGAL